MEEDKLAVLTRIFGTDLTESVIRTTFEENGEEFDPTVDKLTTLPSNKPRPAEAAPVLDVQARENTQRLHTMFPDLTQSVITTVYETNRRDVEGTVDTLLNITSNELASGARREVEVNRQEQEIRAFEEYKKLQQRLQEDERKATEAAQKAAFAKAKEDEGKKEEERRRKAEEEARKAAQLEAQQKVEQQKALLEQERLLKEFQQKKVEEDKRKNEELARRVEEEKRIEADKQRKLLEAQALVAERKRVEADKKRIEEEKKRVEEEKKRTEEERKKAHEEKLRVEGERRALEQKKMDEEKKEMEAKQKEKIKEEMKKKKEEIKEAEDRIMKKRFEEEKAMLQEQRNRAEAERKLLEERMRLERVREEEERRRRYEDEKRYREEQENIRKTWEDKVRQLEKERLEELKKQEQKRSAEEEEKMRQEADMRKILELERLKLDEQRRRVEEEKRIAEERLKAMEFAALKREQEELERIAAQERKKMEEEERARLQEEETRERERQQEELKRRAAEEQFAASAVLVTPVSEAPKVEINATVEGSEIQGTWALKEGALPSTPAWLGLFPRRSNNTYTGFLYASGTSGEFHFKGLTPGHYEVRFFTNKPVSSRISESQVLLVGPKVPVFSAQQQGEHLMLEYTLEAATPSKWDWIGIFEKDQRRNKSYIASAYSTATGAVSIPLPRTPGTYQARLFAAGCKYNEQACVDFVVVDNDCIQAPDTLAPAHNKQLCVDFVVVDNDSVSASETATPDTPLKATYVVRTVEPTSSDWVGLFPVGEPNNSKYLTSVYTSGASVGEVAVTIPKDIAPGAYELRLFSSKVGKYTTFKTSGPIYVAKPE